MMRSPLSALIVAALGTAALNPVMAQGSATKPKASTTHKAATAASAPAGSGEDAVVGVCNSRKVTWGQLVAKIKTENPALLNQSIAAIVGARAGEAFFGGSPKDTFTITRGEALNELRQHPNQQIAQQLELLLTQMAVDDEATREKVQPTEKQVDDKVSKLLKNLRDGGTIPKGQTDAQFLSAHNLTLDKLKSNYRPQCQIINLIEKDLTRKLGHPAGADDIVQASHILVAVKDVPPTATSEEKKKADEAAQVKIKQILAEIRSGKISFADAAKANSDDPGSKDKGGDLGIFMRGMMLKEFENGAFSAKPSVITEPIKSDAGYHIILVTRAGKDIPAPERAQFFDKYETELIQNFLPTVVQKNNKVENRLQKLVPQQQVPQGFGGQRPR
jgi:parvulin-like peptidyl-prolyl isomerase